MFESISIDCPCPATIAAVLPHSSVSTETAAGDGAAAAVDGGGGGGGGGGDGGGDGGGGGGGDGGGDGGVGGGGARLWPVRRRCRFRGSPPTERANRGRPDCPPVGLLPLSVDVLPWAGRAPPAVLRPPPGQP